MSSCSVFCTQFNIKVISVGQTLHTQKKISLHFVHYMISWVILIVGNLYQLHFEYNMHKIYSENVFASISVVWFENLKKKRLQLLIL